MIYMTAGVLQGLAFCLNFEVNPVVITRNVAHVINVGSR